MSIGWETARAVRPTGHKSSSFHVTSTMPVRKAIPEKDGVYFITFTCNNWLPLFKLCNAYDAPYNWLNHLKQNRHYIIGYVIMSNHVHAILLSATQVKALMPSYQMANAL